MRGAGVVQATRNSWLKRLDDEGTRSKMLQRSRRSGVEADGSWEHESNFESATFSNKVSSEDAECTVLNELLLQREQVPSVAC